MNGLFRVAVVLLAAAWLAGCSADAPPEVADNAQVQARGADKDNWWDALPRPEWGAYERIDTGQDWFEIYRIADEIYAIYEPGQFEEVISFLIVGDAQALLFDTGLGIGDMRSVVTGLTDRDIIVLNSHTHYDHIGSNWQFDTIYGRDTAYTRNRAMGSSTAAVAGFLQEGWVWKSLPPGFDPSDYRSRPFEIDVVVDEGDVIDIGGRRLEILNTPGHAPDSICLLDRENRLLFTGDTFYLAPLYTHIEGSDFDAYARTATRLAGLAGEIDSAVTSHNVPVVDASYMTALGDAFAAIQSGEASDVTIADGYREYAFGDFSIIVRDDAQAPGQ